MMVLSCNIKGDFYEFICHVHTFSNKQYNFRDQKNRKSIFSQLRKEIELQRSVLLLTDKVQSPLHGLAPTCHSTLIALIQLSHY